MFPTGRGAVVVGWTEKQREFQEDTMTSRTSMTSSSPWTPLVRPIRAIRGHHRGNAGSPTLYQLTDRLHEGRTVRVPADRIEAVVTAWLAELDVRSDLVSELSCAVCTADWPTVGDIGERLSISVAIAA